MRRIYKTGRSSETTHLVSKVCGGVVGIGSGFYLTARLGAGPRDGLMTGLQKLSGYPIAWVRTSIEIAAVSAGWMLGGVVGIGTLMFAFGIGPAVSLGLFTVNKLFGQATAEVE